MTKISYYNHTWLDKMRQQADPLADEAVEAIYTAGVSSKAMHAALGAMHRNSDPLPENMPVPLQQFLEHSEQLPPWADEKRMQAGARFFDRFTGDLMLMLGMLSLPYDYAAVKGAQVLHMSQRLYNNPGKRLLETGQYVLDVTAKGAFSPQGKAIRSIQKVRLVHASIRYHIRQSGRWDIQTLGVPINQEDMAGTNLSIAMLPVRGLRKLKLEISVEDAAAYQHLWNVASYMMGVDEHLLPDTAKEAFVLEKMIRERHHGSSEAGRELTKALLNFIRTQADSNAQIALPAYMRYLLGDHIADLLAVPQYDTSGDLLIRATKGLNQLRNVFPSLMLPLAGRNGTNPSLQPIQSAARFALPKDLTS